MRDMASLDTLLQVCNVVREAGGGELIDALIPAVPEASSECLIARALNFECNIEPDPHDRGIWTMNLEDKDVRDKIAEKLDWETNMHLDRNGDKVYQLLLPEEIGAVADAFDDWDNAIIEDGAGEWAINSSRPEDVELLELFWPYIEASVKAVYKHAPFINDKGELVL